MKLAAAPPVRQTRPTPPVAAAPIQDVSAKSTLADLGEKAVGSLLFGAKELRYFAGNDPSLAFRTAATAIAPNLMAGVNHPQIVASEDLWCVPVVRASLLAINSYQCVHTFKDKESGFANKALDSIRVASDLAGTIGGLAMLFSPKYAALGAKAVGAAYAFDVSSHAIRTLQHGSNRISAWDAQYHLWKDGEKPSEQLPPVPVNLPIPATS